MNCRFSRFFAAPGRTVLAVVLTTLAAVGPPSPTVTAQQPAAEFTDAIAYAQARTVKVYGARIGREAGYATGMIVSPQGLILTAHGSHLAGERLQVVLPDGSTHRATVERRCEPLQSVLLKIDAVTPNFWELPENAVARQGDWVLAVSNAFKVADGPEPLSVNLGVVALRTRLETKRGTHDVPYQGHVLLLDAITSNPGAPGGAIVTVDGRVAGMIGKIVESKSTNTRLNYAVPADLLHTFVAGKPMADETDAPLTHVKAVLGIRLFTLGGQRGPAYVDRILPNSPAAKAGLKADDLILAVDDHVVRDIRDYDKLVETLKAGRQVTLSIKRKRQLLQISLTPVLGGEH